MLADELDYVIGVDTHRDEHVLAALTRPAGAVVAGRAVRANARGYREALRPGRVECVVLAAQSPLGSRCAADLEHRFAEQYAGARRVWGDRGQRQLRRRHCPLSRRTGRDGVDELATRLVLRSLARRIEAATLEAEQLERELLGHVRALAPGLLDEPGVGEIVAAQLIVAWSHRDRLRSEACFARLAGVAPVPASSGQTVRHRLSRGGDRQLNRAHDRLAPTPTRQRDAGLHRPTNRRGQSRRDATRLLKRYLARHLYRLLQSQEPLMA
jgi:transposase